MPLTEQEVLQFREEGVLVAEGILAAADLAPVIAEYERLIDERAAALSASGQITDCFVDAPFDVRAALLYQQSPEILSGIDIMEARGPAMFSFLSCPSLLDAVERLIGPEITCSPIQHIRAKPPSALAGEGAGYFNVPWHQDAGVTWEEADGSDIITCWIPLVDATEENGCMRVMPGVWRGGFLKHQAEGGTTIVPGLLPDVAPRPVPVRKGGVVFMHRHTPHCSTPNKTVRVRWSIDLRYQPTGQPTGRPFHPEFIVRSRRDPAAAHVSHSEWAESWRIALSAPPPAGAHRV